MYFGAMMNKLNTKKNYAIKRNSRQSEICETAIRTKHQAIGILGPSLNMQSNVDQNGRFMTHDYIRYLKN